MLREHYCIIDISQSFSHTHFFSSQTNQKKYHSTLYSQGKNHGEFSESGPTDAFKEQPRTLKHVLNRAKTQKEKKIAKAHDERSGTTRNGGLGA